MKKSVFALNLKWLYLNKDLTLLVHIFVLYSRNKISKPDAISSSWPTNPQVGAVDAHGEPTCPKGRAWSFTDELVASQKKQNLGNLS